MIPVRDFVTRIDAQVLEKYCGCGCGKPLEPRIDGERHTISGKEVNSDCYFDSLGKVVEDYPIGGNGVRRARLR